MENKVNVLKNYFTARYLHVSNYYLECCLQWLQSQYNPKSDDDLFEKVYEQWLSLDLREMGERSLPADLSKQKKTILQGNFAVQVLFFKDISKSKLSQLQTIRNMYKLTRTNPEKDKENEYETPGRRTLYLQITDGVQTIFAFEYELVKCLNINLAPGTKMLLTGPLTVRNGEILLKNNNVKILGGEVEDLLVCNAVENVLARELGLPENPNPGKVDEEVPNNNNQLPQTNITNNTLQNENQNQQNNVIQNRINQTNNRLNQINETNKRTTTNERQMITNTNSNEKYFPMFNSNPSTSNQSYSNEVNFDDDDDFIIAQIPVEENTNTTNVNSIRNTNINVPKQNFTNVEEFEEEMMDFDFEEHFETEKSSQKNINFPLPVSGEPYIYIKQLIENKNSLINKTVKVRAQFVNVVEKLIFSSSVGWKMKFKITDGSASVVVDFKKEVLEQLVGVDHEQALALKQKIKNKIGGASEKLKEMLYECRAKLTRLNCLMGLRYIEGKEIPTVMWMKNIFQKDLKNLQLRVESVKNM